MLVAIEGIDGAGKRTQAERLLGRAEQREGLRVAGVSFPRYQETRFGAAIAELLAGKLGDDNDPRLVGLLFAGDRFESRHLLADHLAASDLVVADRYVASNLAYQGARAAPAERAAVVAFLADLEYSVYGLPRPDLTVLLDVSVELATARLAARPSAGGRPAKDRYEADPAFLAACRACYLDLAAGQPDWAVIQVGEAGAPRSIEAIAESVWDTVSAARCS